jgi:arsenite-transporting ATPase
MTQITSPMGPYLREHATLKYFFFGGKGGVGKVVFAAAAAIGLARQGHRTLLVSTNPVHSLTSLFGSDMLGKHVPIEGVPNLWAYEIDTRQSIERSKVEIREKIRWFLKFADITTKADDFVESATTNPAFEESAMFENMIDLMSRTNTTPMSSTLRPPPMRDASSACRRSTHCGSTRCSRAARRRGRYARCSPSPRRRKQTR